DGTEHRIPVTELRAGQRFVVRPGERIAADGEVEFGQSAVDRSMMTGESVPADVTEGDAVAAGTVVVAGRLRVRAEKVGRDTQLAHLVALVEQAQSQKAAIQRLADRICGIFVPAVLVASGLTLAGWLLAGSPAERAFSAALAVLIIACPCALGLATPVSIMVGTGRGARAGVLAKNAQALELMEKVDTLVVDKTGTLTEGKPRLAEIVAVGGIAEDELLRLAASLERASEHPLAAAIVAGAAERGLSLAEPSAFASQTGKGVSGAVDGKRVAVGNLALFAALAIDPRDLDARAGELRREGRIVMLAAVDGMAAGLLTVADPVKEGAAAALDALRAEGIRVVMLTGDSRTTAEAVGRRLGITEIAAEILPDRKAQVIQELQARHRFVAMAGDGVNDAPALAQAEVGIAMGTGADIAIESAALTLVKGDLNGILRARRLSRAVMRNIRQNLFFAFVFNAAAIPIAAGALYPAFGLLLNPMIASAAMSASSVLVITNALRLRAVRL
ncbi:MAG: heavy metal translocating P-type ATPase, partial [Stellaceae bacterium]